ncbi:MAG: hypothetical protein JW732_06090 [Dehalococcoidia bacterium]|nr:hypothetical protein [Dehalococcoidia bacterium]
MRRIGILEVIEAHHGLAGSCKIFNTENNKVTVFTSEPIFARIKDELEIGEYELVIKRKEESDLRFLKRVERICNERIDLLVVNTIRIWPFLFFKPKCKKIAEIYNANWWFKSTRSLRDRVRSIREVGRHGLLAPMLNGITGSIIRKMILRRYDGIIVEYQAIKEYITRNFNYKKNIYVLPNFPYECVEPFNEDEKIRFIVPGTISEKRRDYLAVIDIFREIFHRYHKRIELYMLGAPQGEYGQEIMNRCRNLKNEGYNIFYFEEYIPESMFREKFSKADVIIAPVKLNFTLLGLGFDEVYSITKGAGVTSDCIKYAKPFIAPEKFIVSKELKTSVLKYSDARELKEIVETLMNNSEKLRNLQREALNNSEKFSLANLHRYSDKMVNEFLNKEVV